MLSPAARGVGRGTTEIWGFYVMDIICWFRFPEIKKSGARMESRCCEQSLK